MANELEIRREVPTCQVDVRPRPAKLFGDRRQRTGAVDQDLDRVTGPNGQVALRPAADRRRERFLPPELLEAPAVVAADLLGDLAADPALRVQQKVSRVATAQMRRNPASLDEDGTNAITTAETTSAKADGDEREQSAGACITALSSRGAREETWRGVWSPFPPASSAARATFGGCSALRVGRRFRLVSGFAAAAERPFPRRRLHGRCAKS